MSAANYWTPPASPLQQRDAHRSRRRYQITAAVIAVLMVVVVVAAVIFFATVAGIANGLSHFAHNG